MSDAGRGKDAVTCVQNGKNRSGGFALLMAGPRHGTSAAAAGTGGAPLLFIADQFTDSKRDNDKENQADEKCPSIVCEPVDHEIGSSLSGMPSEQPAAS